MADGLIVFDTGMVVMMGAKFLVLGLAIWQLVVIRRINRAKRRPE
ncbi:MAG: hypothetical protein AAF713_06225 [Pseudomonadota bacterium]